LKYHFLTFFILRNNKILFHVEVILLANIKIICITVRYFIDELLNNKLGKKINNNKIEIKNPDFVDG
jgi:hypothetical protein